MTTTTTTATLLSGGEPAPLGVEFVCGAAFAAAAVGAAAYVSNAATGQRTRTLANSANAGGGRIVGLAASPANAFVLFAAHEGKQVNVWDVSDGVLLKTWSFKDNIAHFKQDKNDPNAFFIVFAVAPHKKSSSTATTPTPTSTSSSTITAPTASSSSSSSTTFKLERVSLKLLEDSSSVKKKQLDSDRVLNSLLPAGFKYDVGGLAVSSSVVSIFTDKAVFVWDATLSSVGFGDPKRINIPKKQQIHNPKITCLAAHPTTTLISAGLSTGEILLYHNPLHSSNNSNNNHPPAVQILHWHANPVLSLAFMNDGTTLLSGGVESVLVMWQTDLLSKRTIPRLAAGNSLLSISVSEDDALIGVVCGDASVRVISVANLAVKTCITGLKAREGRVLAGGNGLVVDPRTGNLVVAGNVGCIQFYDALRDTHVMEVEAVAQNRIVVSGGVDKEGGSIVPNKTDAAEVGLAAVKFVAFEQEGRRSRWMATLDERDSMCVGGESEVSLKFWLWDEVNQIYTVNTRVASPHDGPITSIRFFSVPHESDASKKVLHLISTSLDTRFKVWELTPAPATSRDQTPSWTQKSQGFHKDAPIYSAAASSDGSMLAVACGSIVTLWDPSTNQMCATLCHPHAKEHVSKVEFVGGDASGSDSGTDIPCLVAVTSTRLYVWNLLTATVWWSIELGGLALGITVDPDTNRFAVSVGIRASSLPTPPPHVAGNDSGVELDSEEALKKSKVLSTSILEFQVSSPVPTMTYSGEGKVQGLQYISQSHVPVNTNTVDNGATTAANTTTPRLLVLSSKYEIIAIGASSPPPPPSSTTTTTQTSLKSTPENNGLFSGIYGPSAFDKTPTTTHLATTATQAAKSGLQTTRDLARIESERLSFLDAASHLLAPPVKLAAPFFEAVLKKRDFGKEGEERARFGIRGVSSGGGGGGGGNGDDEAAAATVVAMEDVVVEDRRRQQQQVREVGEQDLRDMEFLSGLLKKVAVSNQKEVKMASEEEKGQAKLLTVSKKVATPVVAAAVSTPVIGTPKLGGGVVVSDTPVKSMGSSGKKAKSLGKKGGF
ncbi:WD40-repeat-containing domain protein [Obelidium mucronatum]|nr:WD40-repeat-containing domain protein [Obelidium mucronatum]